MGSDIEAESGSERALNPLGPGRPCPSCCRLGRSSLGLCLSLTVEIPLGFPGVPEAPSPPRFGLPVQVAASLSCFGFPLFRPEA